MNWKNILRFCRSRQGVDNCQRLSFWNSGQSFILLEIVLFCKVNSSSLLKHGLCWWQECRKWLRLLNEIQFKIRFKGQEPCVQKHKCSETSFAKNVTSRDLTDKEQATNSFSRGDGNVLRAMMQALGDSGCVTYIFPFQRSPEILGVSSQSGETWQEVSPSVYLKCSSREVWDIRSQDYKKIWK